MSDVARAGANIIRLAANDPNLDNLRSDRRFQEMLEVAKSRVGMTIAAGGPANDLPRES